MMAIPTDDLIRRYQAGQTDLFEALFDRYKDYVYRVAFSLTKHAAESEEVVQDTFLDVLKALPRYDVEGAARFETWLYRVTINRCKMRFRRKQLPTADWDDVGEQLAELQSNHREHNPEHAVERSQTRRSIWQAVGRLGDIYRQVVVLRYDRSFSYQEIADALNLSIGTVKSRLNTAHRRLQEMLSGSGDSDDQNVPRRSGRGQHLSAILWCLAASLYAPQDRVCFA